MIIPISNPGLQNTLLAPELLDVTQKVIYSGQYIIGQWLKKFQFDFAQYHGVNYCLGVNSGTDALNLALRATEIGPGDEVIVPAMTFVATAEAVAKTGAKPVLCDITNDGKDLIDVSLIPSLITERTKAIIPVHLHGYMCDMKAIMDIAADHNLVVIEDCAQATGASMIIGDKRYYAGTLGHIGCFSFFPTKNLGCIGDGGAIITNEDAVAAEIEELRQHGGAKNNPKVVGENSRLDGLQAAYLSLKLDFLDEWNAARKANAQHYRAAFRNHAIKNPEFARLLDEYITLCPESEECVYHHFMVCVESNLVSHSHRGMRDALIKELAVRDIGAMAYYPLAIGDIHAYFDAVKAYPNAQKQSGTNIGLPMYPELTKSEIAYVVSWFVDIVTKLYEARPD